MPTAPRAPSSSTPPPARSSTSSRTSAPTRMGDRGGSRRRSCPRRATAGRTSQFVDAGAIKDTYVLDYEWDVDEAGTGVVSWGLVKATVLKAMNGSYTLAAKGSSTDVTYRLAVDLNIPHAGMLKAQGGEGHRRHRTAGAEEARRGLTARDRPLHLGEGRRRQDHYGGGRARSGPPAPALAPWSCLYDAAPRRRARRRPRRGRYGGRAARGGAAPPC